MNFAPICSYENFQISEKDIGEKKMRTDKIFKDDITKTPFLFFQERSYDNDNNAKTALKSFFEVDAVSSEFFSERNINRLQKLIKSEVLRRTRKFKLEEDQDVNSLMICMRAQYLLYSRNELADVATQVDELNKIVLNEIIPNIITELKQYFGYLRDINTPITPMDRPLNVSNKGTKTLPSISTVIKDTYKK
jgi:hypothetical protein